MPKRLKELTVLYVEDEPHVMEEITEILEIKIDKLYTAENGLEALEIYRNNDIDIIITDIQMPIMNGLEMIEKIREINSSIPVIITTAFNETTFFKKAIDLHVDKYITKPIDIYQLLNVLDRAAEVIFQKKEIDQRDMIIKKILDMHPCYSLLIDSENIEKVHLEILAFLGYGDSSEFSYFHANNKEGCNKLNNIDKLTKLILSFKENNLKDESICLKPKDKDIIKYVLKPYFFKDTDIFLLAFFEYDKAKEDESLFQYVDNTACGSCQMHIMKKEIL